MLFEGAANLFSSLYTGQPIIGSSYLDAAYSIVDFVRFPDLVPTQEDEQNRLIQAPVFSKKYPTTKNGAKQLLFMMSEEMKKAPGSYTATAAINGPLWFASLEFGKDKIVRIYIKSLKEMKYYSKLDDLANSILKFSLDKKVYDFLKYQFKSRGL